MTIHWCFNRLTSIMMALTRQQNVIWMLPKMVLLQKTNSGPDLGAETDANHTAAIDILLIVCVKLVAPGERDGNVVKQQSSRFTLY